MRKLTRHWRWAVPTVAATAAVAAAAVAFGPMANAEGDSQSKSKEWEVVYGDADLGGAFTDLATADGKAWAFGSGSSEDGNTAQTRISFYDGKKWSEQDVPDGLTEPPEMATAASSQEVWAKTEESTQLLRFDGSKWTTVEPDLGEANNVTALDAATEKDLWLVPNYGAKGEFKRFDGSQWSSVPAPKGVTAGLGSDDQNADVYAVGNVGDEGNTTATVNRWQDGKWKSLDFPEIKPDKECSDARLDHVEPAAQDDVWVAGEVTCIGEDEAEYTKPLSGHWNGQEWDYTVGDKKTSTFSDVASDGDGGAWLAGDHTLTHATADGDEQEYEIGNDNTGRLTVEHLDGTKMLGSAVRYGKDYGAVLGYGV